MIVIPSFQSPILIMRSFSLNAVAVIEISSYIPFRDTDLFKHGSDFEFGNPNIKDF